MVHLATELRETLQYMLQAGGPDNPVLSRLIDSYRDIARELGQQSDVERTLRDLLPFVRSEARPAQVDPPAASHSSRKISPSHTSRKSPSR